MGAGAVGNPMREEEAGGQGPSHCQQRRCRHVGPCECTQADMHAHARIHTCVHTDVCLESCTVLWGFPFMLCVSHEVHCLVSGVCVSGNGGDIPFRFPTEYVL